MAGAGDDLQIAEDLRVLGVLNLTGSYQDPRHASLWSLDTQVAVDGRADFSNELRPGAVADAQVACSKPGPNQRRASARAVGDGDVAFRHQPANSVDVIVPNAVRDHKIPAKDAA